MTSRSESSTSRRFLGTILSGRVSSTLRFTTPFTMASARVVRAPAADNSPMTIEHVQEMLPRNKPAARPLPPPSSLVFGSRSWSS